MRIALFHGGGGFAGDENLSIVGLGPFGTPRSAAGRLKVSSQSSARNPRYFCEKAPVGLIHVFGP